MKILSLISILLFSSSLISQERVTLAEAIAIALEQNYDIQIARNNQISSDKGVTKSLSDNFLPSISLSGNSTVINSSQENFINQQSFGTQETKNTFFGASMGINLQINDVYQAIKTYARSKTDNEQQYHNTMTQIQSLVKTVMSNYFNLAKQQNLLKVQSRAVETSKEQVKRAQSRYEIGSAAKKDVMSQKVQLNNDRSSLLSQKLQVQTAQNQLNISLGRRPFDKIIVDESVLVERKYTDYASLESEMLKANPELKASKKSFKSAKLQKDQADYSLYIPSVGISLGYNRSVSNDTDLQKTIDRISDFNTNFNANARLSLSYSFNLGKVIQSQQAELGTRNAQLQTLKKERELKASLYQAYITYTNSLEQLKLQEENVEAAREDLRLAQERYNLGSGTSIDLRQAQDGLTRSETNLVNAKFDAKLAEVEIERLLGKIKTK